MGILATRRRQGPQGRQNPRSPHHVLITAGGGRTRAGGRGREPTPHSTNLGAGDQWRVQSGATGREGEGNNSSGGEDGGGSRGRRAPGSAAAAGGLVGRDRASQGVGIYSSGYTPAQTPAVSQAALEGSQVRARPAPESNADQQTAGGDDTPRRAGATKSTANKDMADRATLERQRALNASG